MQIKIFWICAIIVFALTEGLTAGLVSIWFAVGALMGLIASLFTQSIFTQSVVFILTSAICFILMRKFALGEFKKKNSQTGIDRLIGEKIIITKTVDNLKNEGLAKVNDLEWKVKSVNDEIIDEGKIAIVEKIEGVKLIVRGE